MSDFSGLIGRLWQHLDLGTPAIDAGGRISFEVDERVIVLELSPDERDVLVRASLEPLSQDRAVRDDQMRRLLRDTLGLAVLNEAGTHLVQEAGTTTLSVAVVASAPCRADGLVELVHAVEDVLQRLDLHGERLAGGARATSRARPLDVSADDVIIRL